MRSQDEKISHLRAHKIETTRYNLKFDYHLFPNLKKFLRGKQLESEEEIKSEIESWTLSLSENFGHPRAEGF
jgi:hypothetical protein